MNERNFWFSFKYIKILKASKAFSLLISNFFKKQSLTKGFHFDTLYASHDENKRLSSDFSSKFYLIYCKVIPRDEWKVRQLTKSSSWCKYLDTKLHSGTRNGLQSGCLLMSLLDIISPQNSAAEWSKHLFTYSNWSELPKPSKKRMLKLKPSCMTQMHNRPSVWKEQCGQSWPEVGRVLT